MALKLIRHCGTIAATDLADDTAAGLALGKLGKGAVPNLIQTLQNPDPEVRFSTARILGSIGKGAVDAVPALIQLLQEQDPEDRGAINSWTIPRVAAEALEKIDALFSKRFGEPE